MPPQQGAGTLEYDPEAVSKFLTLDADKQDQVFGSMSSGAQQALLLGLRTLRKSKVYGATTPTNIPEAAPSSGKAGTTYRESGGFVRVPTIGEETKSFGQAGLEAAQETLPGVAKGLGAGLAVAAMPADAPILAMGGAAAFGGATGEAAEQLTKRATGLGEIPETSEEAGLDIAKAGTEMGLLETGGKALGEVYRGLSKYFDPLVFGQEGVFRAAGPTSDPQFFDNVKAASYDLANIYQQTEKQIRDARGGFLNADHRYRATVQGIDNYLKQMYQTERAGQINTAAQYGSRVVVPGNANEIQFMGRWLSRQLPMNSPALRAAELLANNPLAPIPIQDADALAIAVNSYDLKSAIDRATSKVLSGKNAIDQGLKRGINDTLRNVGQPGIESYERRYAALSRVKEALENKMNKVQAQRTSDRLRAFFSLHGLYARGSVESLEPPGGALEESLSKLSKAQKKGMIPEPRSSRAVPPNILQGEVMPEEGGLATTPPRAGEPPPGRGGGMAPPPQQIDISKSPYLLPEQAERRVTRGVSPTGAERRTIPFKDITGPSPARASNMRDIQQKIELLDKDDPVRKVLQDRLDDMKAHPFEQSSGREDIGKMRTAGKEPEGKLTPQQHLLRRAAPGHHVPGTHYTDEGLRQTFSIPHTMRMEDLIKAGAVERNPDGTFSVVGEIRGNGKMKPPPKPSSDIDF